MLALGDPSSEFYVPGNKLIINDLNPDLITTYKTLRDKPHNLIKLLKNLEPHVSREDYEKMRKSKPKSDLQKAARFIYLNKTCFNGLWRVNSKGEFNVPWGKIAKPSLLDSDNLMNVSLRLQKSKILNSDFADSVKSSKSGDLVYFDPPYIPLSTTASFSAYAKDGFGLNAQEKLAEVIDELTSKGVHVILSNSDTKLTKQIFGKSLKFRTINVRRSISANASSRLKITELIGTNEGKLK